jgi:hypothetical protein
MRRIRSLSLAALIGVILFSSCGKKEPDFTIVLFPDTGKYMTATRSDIWYSQCQWVVDNRGKQNIVAAIGLGDMTEFASEQDYAIAKKGYDLIEAAGIPVMPALGTHDYQAYDDTASPQRVETLWDSNFGQAWLDRQTWFGGSFSGFPSNYWGRFEVGSRRFLILVLEVFPRPEVVAWASSVVDANRDREAILVTHSYMNIDGSLAKDDDEWGTVRFMASPIALSGEELWRDLISKKANIRAVVCGHLGSTNSAYRVAKNAAGKPVHQFLMDYEWGPGGGDGWVGIFAFRPSRGKVDIGVYRTWARSGLGWDPKSKYSTGRFTVNWRP